MYTFERYEKRVKCPSCYGDWASIKYTKTNHLMLRCDECKLLLFANSLDSQDGVFRFCNISAQDVDVLNQHDNFNEFVF